MALYAGNYSNPSPAIAHLPVILQINFKESFTNIPFTGDAIIDTGADVSSIPNSLVTRYGLTSRNTVPGFLPGGAAQNFKAYLLEVTLPGLTTITEEFIDYGFNEIILGRTILNNWMITLDPSHKTPGASSIQIQD